jgi:hypothetical protein
LGLEVELTRPTQFPNDILRAVTPAFENLFSPSTAYSATGVILCKLTETYYGPPRRATPGATPEAVHLGGAFWESAGHSCAPRLAPGSPTGRCQPTGGWRVSLGRTRRSEAEDRVRSTHVAGAARYPGVALLLVMAWESLRRRWDACGNHPPPFKQKGRLN